MEDVKLTQYSHGAGCGCKISPAILDTILSQHDSFRDVSYEHLLVGNESRDDAAVMDIGNGTAIISTTDFFMPIVDDPETFGRIASVNAISDVYAMGGKPIMAIGILGWPINKLAPEVANRVMNGAKRACAEAKIPLAGGHSIDSPEPIFGLAVTGVVSVDDLKTNSNAKANDVLFLTKPIGVGILTTAQKKGKLKPDHADLAIKSMTALNMIGEHLGKLDFVHALTDVTGFGLLGHLKEICLASNVCAKLNFKKVPLLDRAAIDYYLEEGCIPGGTKRNWDSYGKHVDQITDYQRNVLCDPQTSGGLLIAVDPKHADDMASMLKASNLNFEQIGRLDEAKNETVCISILN